MSFGVSKCVILTSSSVNPIDKKFKLSEEDIPTPEFYDYLEFKWSPQLKLHEQLKKYLNKASAALSVITKVQLTLLTAIKLVNTVIVSQFTYLISILPWTKTDIEKMDKRIRNAARKLTLLPNITNDMLYKQPHEKGLGLQSVAQIRSNATH